MSQLLIMTNGRTKAARYKMAKQVSQMILKSSPKSEDATERKTTSAQLRSNLQLFAKLHREERKTLGKKIFEQISKLYAGGEDAKKSSSNAASPSIKVKKEIVAPIVEEEEEAEAAAAAVMGDHPAAELHS